MLFHRAATMLKVNGVISIVLGGLATLIVLLYAILIVVAALISTDPHASLSNPDSGSNALVSLVIFTLLLAPCLYTLIAGILLVRLPRPPVAKGLLIANIVIGAFANTIGLIFAIISLTQIRDYEVGYKHAK
jgi:hypothetical protein